MFNKLNEMMSDPILIRTVLIEGKTSSVYTVTLFFKINYLLGHPALSKLTPITHWSVSFFIILHLFPACQWDLQYFFMCIAFICETVAKQCYR